MVQKIKLIDRSFDSDNILVETYTETAREIIGDVTSVSKSEFFQAGRIGLNPELKVVIYSFEWHGEKIVEVKGVRYSVYRIYEITGTDRLELYLESKGGTKDESE